MLYTEDILRVYLYIVRFLVGFKLSLSLSPKYKELHFTTEFMLIQTTYSEANH